MKSWFELKYALRTLKHSPAQTGTCVAIVAISAAIAIFTLTFVYNAIYRPVPLPGADRWVNLARVSGQSGFVMGPDTVDPYLYQRIRTQSSSFEVLGTARLFGYSRLTVDDGTTRITSAEVSGNLFEATKAKAILGRTLRPGDRLQSDERAAVLSHSLWENYFSSDQNVVGKQIQLDERFFTVVGVMPGDSYFGIRHDIWIPSPVATLDRPNDQLQSITPIGLLKPGIKPASAQIELNQIITNVTTDFPESYDQSLKINLNPLNRLMNPNDTPIYATITAITVVILLLGCLNIGNLFVSRSIERHREFAIRAAVGSSPKNLLQHSLTESGLIVLCGLFIGLPIGIFCLNLANQTINSSAGGNSYGAIPPHWVLGLDLPTLLIAGGTVVIIWLVSGLFPIWRLNNMDINAILGNGSKGSSSPSNFRAIKCLVGFEVVTSCFLLIVSIGLMIAISKAVNTDFGIRTEGLYLTEIEASREYSDEEKLNTLFEEIKRRLESNPSIEEVAFSTGLPYDFWGISYELNDRDVATNGTYPQVFGTSISENYLSMLEVSIVEGRDFNNYDAARNDLVILVDHSFAQKYWPNESPLGKEVTLNPKSNNLTATIIGVTTNTVPQLSYATPSSTSTLYLNVHQFSRGRINLIIDTPITDASIFTTVQEEVHGINGGIAVYNPRSLSQYLSWQSAGIKVIGNFFLLISLVTLGLSITGIFSIIARSVLQQTEDIGIRRALGSTNKKVLWMYARQGITYLIVGSVIGGSLAVVVSSSLTSYFNDLATNTPIVVVLVVVGLGILTVVSSILPARKALKHEPGDALHQI